MPIRFKKKYRKKFYKKKKDYGKIVTYENKRSGNNVKYVICKQVGVPDRFFTQLCLTAEMNTTQTTLYTFNFYLSSLFDCFQTHGAQQPMWFDQLSTLYAYYRVTGAYCNYQFTLDPGSDPMKICVYSNTASAGPTDIEEARQRKGARYIILGGTTNSGLKKMSKYYNFRSYIGENLTDDIYGSSIASDPSYGVYNHISSIRTSGSGTCSLRIHVYIKFYCSFFDRIAQTRS